MFRTWLIGLVVVASLGGIAFGQDLSQPSGKISVALNDLNRLHLSPTGKPCLTITTHAKAQLINPKIFEHLVVAANACGQRIKLKVCYSGTQDCVVMDVPPFGEKETVVGIFPALKYFKIETKEQF
jgi:hypothetical protein